MADLAEKATKDADKLLANARRSLRTATAKAVRLKAVGGLDPVAGRRQGRLRRAVDHLAELVAATRQIAAQTRVRLAGKVPDGARRRVSLHESDARPIAKGRLGKPVEFGYKAQVTDTDDGIVVDHTVEQGNPTDAPQLAPAVKRVIARTGRKPRTVTADRGYGQQSVEDDLQDLGVRHVVIPRKGKPGKARQIVERRPAFRRTIKWRTGCEGRISTLKRGYGLDRSRIDGTEEPGSGSDTASWPTTWSRSPPSPPEIRPRGHPTRKGTSRRWRSAPAAHDHGLFQVEVARSIGLG